MAEVSRFQYNTTGNKGKEMRPSSPQLLLCPILVLILPHRSSVQASSGPAFSDVTSICHVQFALSHPVPGGRNACA